MMRKIRIFQSGNWSTDQELILDKAASHHLQNVLRLEKNQVIQVFNGKGLEHTALIIDVQKQQLTVLIQALVSNQSESPLAIHLGQAISRGEKMDFTIQKAVELGVTEITPLWTERCEVKLSAERSEKRLAHWQQIIISACEQSGRNQLPLLHPPTALQQWFSNIQTPHRIILHPHQHQVRPPQIINAIAVAVGPEGGFSEKEIMLAQQHQFIPTVLGPRILRTETAGLAAIAALQTRYGDFNEA